LCQALRACRHNALAGGQAERPIRCVLLACKLTWEVFAESFEAIMPVCWLSVLGDKRMATTSPSITIRVDAETQDLLTKAAALAGMSSLNSFVLNAAIEKARQVIEREQVLKLSWADAVLLM